MSYAFRSSARKKIVISFDWHHDKDYRNLLWAWLENPDFDVDFVDLTPGAIDTSDVGRVKAVLTTRIRESTHMLVLVGAHANSYHPDREKIETRNWQWWEIEQASAENKNFIAVKINASNHLPEPLLTVNYTLASSFAKDAVIKAIKDA